MGADQGLGLRCPSLLHLLCVTQREGSISIRWRCSVSCGSISVSALSRGATPPAPHTHGVSLPLSHHSCPVSAGCVMRQSGAELNTELFGGTPATGFLPQKLEGPGSRSRKRRPHLLPGTTGP